MPSRQRCAPPTMPNWCAPPVSIRRRSAPWRDGYDLLDTAFALRYQVYCEERGFLDPTQYPAHIESDAYDETSVHFIGRHRFRYTAAGTARLVLPSHQGFPLQTHCDFNREFSFIQEPGHPALRDYAEISRLAVSKFFRQRTDDTAYGGPPRPETVSEGQSVAAGLGLSPDDAGPEIVSGLFKSMYHQQFPANTHSMRYHSNHLDSNFCRPRRTLSTIGC